MAQAGLFRTWVRAARGELTMATRPIHSSIYLAGVIVFAAPALFFAWYTLRLIYINLTVPEARSHWSGGMLVGAIAFPLAVLVFGSISWLCFGRFRGSKRTK